MCSTFFGLSIPAVQVAAAPWFRAGADLLNAREHAPEAAKDAVRAATDGPGAAGVLPADDASLSVRLDLVAITLGANQPPASRCIADVARARRRHSIVVLTWYLCYRYADAILASSATSAP